MRAIASAFLRDKVCARVVYGREIKNFFFAVVRRFCRDV